MNDYFEIGKIVNTQGIKGDVRIIPMTDDIKRFELLKEVEIYTNKWTKTLTIERVWYHKQFVIIKFKEINSMTEGETLKESLIRIPSELALPLNEDEYYSRDLYDMSVVTENGENLGVITSIINTGANDVYEITNDKKETILIPAIKQCILNVNVQEKLMTVHLLEGLR